MWILALAKRCIRFSPQQVHLHWYGAARKIPRIFHTTQTPMPHFTPHFNDPRSRGWGGREYVHDFGRSSGYHRRFFFAWLGSSALFALPVTQMPLNVLAAVLLLWLISVFCMLHDVCTKRRVGRKPYPPAVICDPQGLTLYNTGRSITQQWRWQALDSVIVKSLIKSNKDKEPKQQGIHISQPPLFPQPLDPCPGLLYRVEIRAIGRKPQHRMSLSL